MSLVFYDAHNHLQDDRLAAHAEGIHAVALQEGICGQVVNGTREEDWPAVRELALRHQEVIPCYGLHPWHVASRSPDWQKQLLHFIDLPGGCGVGEIGLDRWIHGHDIRQQEEVFVWQWQLAASRNLPASIHCLRAWGRLLEILRAEPPPRRGFLLHSYGGPREMIPGFVDLGAYFSLSGYFAHDRKGRQREAFQHVPLDRLLLETDAPDMLPPEKWIRFPLEETPTGKPLNHPGNLRAIYEFAAELRGMNLEKLSAAVEQNFQRFFSIQPSRSGRMRLP